MLTSLGLRPKLLLIMVGGALLLATILSAITAGALLHAQNQALHEAETGLKGLGSDNLRQLVHRSTTLTKERLINAANASALAEQALLAEERRQLIGEDYTSRVQLTRQPNGGLLDTQAGQVTTVYLPPQAGATITAALRDVETSAILDALFPKQQVNTRNIIAMAYIGPSGLVRLYPSHPPSDHDFARELSLLEQLRDSQPGTQLWLQPFRNLELINHGGLVTAVAKPVYERNTFLGIVITYISINQIAIDLAQISPTPGGFAFLLDRQKTLISAPPEALPLLLNTSAEPLQEPRKIIQTSSTELDQLLDAMTTGSSDIAQLTVAGRSYYLAYDRIPANNWSLGLMVPVDELTSQAGRVSNAIRDTSRQALLWIIISAVVFALVALMISLYISNRLTKPLSRLAEAAGAIAQGDYNQQVVASSNDEVGKVTDAFNIMSQSVLSSRTQLKDQNRQLEEMVQARTVDLQSTVQRLEGSLQQQAELYELLRGVSTPVIPVAHGVLLMPLIGALDEERANQAVQTLLDNVEAQRSKVVILDVTGLPVIDTAVASTLLRATQAVRLLGAETMLAGIRPEVAETLIMLGVGLEDLQPTANLQIALAKALQQREHSSTTNGS